MGFFRKALISCIAVVSLFGISNAEANQEETPWYNSIKITGGITAVLQGTSGNDDVTDTDFGEDGVANNADDVRTSGAKDHLDYAYTLDLSLESKIDEGQMVYVHIETGEGEGGGNNFSSTMSPNYDPYNTHNTDVGHQDVTISQAYYEGSFLNNLLTVDAGKMDIHSLTDENSFAGDETAQFMTGIFSRLTGTLFTELDNYYAPGVRFLLSPVKLVELTYVAANSNNEKLGIRPFQAGQVNIKPSIMGLEGNYRFYYIHDGRAYTTISDGSTEINRGWGVSLDQFITKDVGLFFRYGAQDDKLTENTVVSALSGGISLTGVLWNRENDSLGIGYGVVEKNDDIATAYDGDQSVMELFYHLQLSERLALTPDVQFHGNLPRVNKRSITVYGLRAQLDF